jgi:hypothetical protein
MSVVAPGDMAKNFVSRPPSGLFFCIVRRDFLKIGVNFQVQNKIDIIKKIATDTFLVSEEPGGSLRRSGLAFLPGLTRIKEPA